ncbi:pilus assembly protein [Rhizobiaceae bacterium n13]|uniref:TadE/TadG family type IV pilus assembly protein n=1 Tax=Ferirhizobium litorale TaxID=2927786 RepID=UPI0024B2FE50|nr:TadE/TadG family type IV pilus assembly protein [Fererhizobium litorale]MDI7865197.1 pilus assembly protein [Fererhizobium litorale]
MWDSVKEHRKRLVEDESGNFAVMTALAMVPLLAAASIALNLANAVTEATKMQDALDSAAISAARAYGEGESADEATKLANGAFFSNFERPSILDGGEPNGSEAMGSAVQVAFSKIGQETVAEATYALEYDPFFWSLDKYTISRASVAARMPGKETCILALHPTANRAFEVTGSAEVDTSGCTITSNSTDAQSIYLGGTGTLKSECLYASGKISATLANLTLACENPLENVPPTPDPFKYKTMPISGPWVSLSGCGQNFVGSGGGNGDCNGTGKTPNKVPDGYAVSLKPGTYGSLEIKGRVHLQPGDYIIDGGSLKFASQSIVTGDQVTFFLLNGAQIDIHGGATFEITASTSGTWAGFSIVADRKNASTAIINGNSSSALRGIIYMPFAKEIQYSGNGSTSGECVRIIAQEITMIGNSKFKLDCKVDLADNKVTTQGPFESSGDAIPTCG